MIKLVEYHKHYIDIFLEDTTIDEIFATYNSYLKQAHSSLDIELYSELLLNMRSAIKINDLTILGDINAKLRRKYFSVGFIATEKRKILYARIILFININTQNGGLLNIFRHVHARINNNFFIKHYINIISFLKNNTKKMAFFLIHYQSFDLYRRKYKNLMCNILKKEFDENKFDVVIENGYLGITIRRFFNINNFNIIGEYKLDTNDLYLSLNIMHAKTYKLKTNFFKNIECYIIETIKKNRNVIVEAVDNKKLPVDAIIVSEVLNVAWRGVTICDGIKQIEDIFYKLRDKGIFWSYRKDLQYTDLPESIFIEYTLKYADFSDISLIIKHFGQEKVKSVWEKTIVSDKAFIKTNLMLAKIFFDMDVESDYFKNKVSKRIYENM